MRAINTAWEETTSVREESVREEEIEDRSYEIEQ